MPGMYALGGGRIVMPSACECAVIGGTGCADCAQLDIILFCCTLTCAPLACIS
jgi:hypothetical protein